mmetsp:Transcript_65015/g.142559  ORF Transcript_65015/g.142559 Transcript_65015/m.142559 type:complete len:240 (-) Transcript_65015:991-1710(-)
MSIQRNFISPRHIHPADLQPGAQLGGGEGQFQEQSGQEPQQTAHAHVQQIITGDHQIVGSTALEGTALVQPEPRVLPGDEIRQGIRQTKVGQNPEEVDQHILCQILGGWQDGQDDGHDHENSTGEEVHNQQQILRRSVGVEEEGQHVGERCAADSVHQHRQTGPGQSLSTDQRVDAKGSDEEHGKGGGHQVIQDVPNPGGKPVAHEVHSADDLQMFAARLPFQDHKGAHGGGDEGEAQG